MSTLLDAYTLVNIEMLKLGAELHRTMPPSEHCQARIELKLSPQTPIADSVSQVGQIMNARLGVLGLPPNGREEDKLFTLEVVINATYRPLVDQFGNPIGDVSFDAFSRGHTSLARQLFPILERRAHQLLLELGISHIRLPLDLVHEHSSEPAVRPAYH